MSGEPGLLDMVGAISSELEHEMRLAQREERQLRGPRHKQARTAARRVFRAYAQSLNLVLGLRQELVRRFGPLEELRRQQLQTR